MGEWLRSSFCDAGQCVEVKYRKAKASLANGSCVEVGSGHGEGCGLVHVRDGKDPDGPVLDFTGEQWSELLNRIKDGYQPPYAFLRVEDGGRDLVKDGVTLSFTYVEWDKFCAGVDDGEFDLVGSAA